MFEPEIAGLTGSDLLRWRLAAGAVLLALLYAGFRVRAGVAERMGFTDADVALLTVGGLAAPVLSVPLAVVGEAVFAVNLGGALVPLILAWRLYHRGQLPLGRTLLGAVPVAAVTWWVVDVEPGVGVVAEFPAFLAPALTALVVGLVAGGIRPARAGSIALGSGSLGALVGADLLALPEVLELARQAPAGTTLIVGGAGSFDLVFLAGAIGLGLSLVLTLLTTRPESAGIGAQGDPLRVPAPSQVLSQADGLPGLTPRERALAALARANLALETDRRQQARAQARKAVDELLRSGDPSLLDRIQAGDADGDVVADVQALDRATRTAGEPEWEATADAVEAAKHLAGRLWPWAPGRVRLQGWSR